MQTFLTDNLKMRQVSEKFVPTPRPWSANFWLKKTFSLCTSALLSRFGTIGLFVHSKNKDRAKRNTFWHHSRHWEGHDRQLNALPKKKSSRNASNHKTNVEINASLTKDSVGLGGLGVTGLTRDHRFAGSNPAEVDGFFQDVKILSTSPPILRFQAL